MDLIGGHLPELIILLIVILIIWGPGKLPDLGAAVGRGIREFRNASAETREVSGQRNDDTTGAGSSSACAGGPGCGARGRGTFRRFDALGRRLTHPGDSCGGAGNA